MAISSMLWFSALEYAIMPLCSGLEPNSSSSPSSRTDMFLGGVEGSAHVSSSSIGAKSM